jgi:hypothetical protein
LYSHCSIRRSMSDADQADAQRRQQQRPPVADAEVFEPHPGEHGAHHVEGAMGEVDDVQHAEDHGQPEAQHGVERAIDQPEHELAHQQGLDGTPKISVMRTSSRQGLTS